LVLVDGHRSVLTTIQKNGNVSTLDIIAHVKRLLPKIAAALTALMILLFLGSWRSTLIITVSIPLAVLSSIAMLSALGESINVMTLGGLALAIGILVDDATVTIENINWHLEQGKSVVAAIIDGSRQIVTPALVSLLCICIVFVPMFFLSGVARYLFVPMAEAVIFALIASFVLSRTLVPTMAKYLLRPHVDPHPLTAHPLEDALREEPTQHMAAGISFLSRWQRAFERRFEDVREVYRASLGLALAHPRAFVLGFLGTIGVSLLLLTPWLGENFFVAQDIQAVLDATAKDVPKGSTVALRGQVETMRHSYTSLWFGLAGAASVDLLADRGQLPVVAGSVRHHHGLAGGARRHRLDAVPDGHDLVGAGADWGDSVPGCGHRQ
jgi:multidrug efflux pump subunit AcrB